MFEGSPSFLEAKQHRHPSMTKGSDLLVAALENEGVERIFGIPGEENLDVVESIRKSSIELVLTRHEQAAAFMAATYGRLTGKPGVCLTTLGPGALNLSTGAAYALLGAMPMVMITGQKGILSSRQARFQVVDVVASMKPLTKLARQIVSPQMIPTTVREAFRIAQEERPGPVHLELPEDIAAEECQEVALIAPHQLELPTASDAALRIEHRGNHRRRQPGSHRGKSVIEQQRVRHPRPVVAGEPDLVHAVVERQDAVVRHHLSYIVDQPLRCEAILRRPRRDALENALPQMEKRLRVRQLALKAVRQRLQRGADIADDLGLREVDLLDSRRLISDMDHLRAALTHDEWRLLDGVMADRDDEVGLFDGLVDIVALRQRRGAHVKFGSTRHRSLPHLGREERDARADHELGDI